MPDRRFVAAPRLFVGGAVRAGGGVLVEDGLITAVQANGIVGVPSGAVASGAVVDEYPGTTLLPGFVDAHVHLCLGHDEELHGPVDDTLVEQGVDRGHATANALVRAGVTTARDLGCRGNSAQRVRDGLSARSLRLVAAGRPITSPGGHFASFGIPVSDPVQACRAVEDLVDDGADLVKVMATGGILTPRTAPGRAQFGLEVVDALTRHAHRLGLRVAAHAHGTEGIAIAVDAGVDTIEHCTWLQADAGPGVPEMELVRRMVRGGQTVVMAGPIPDGLVAPDGSHEAQPPAGSASPARGEALRRSWENMAVLREAGVRLALGTDSFFGQFQDTKDLAYRAEAMVRLGGWDALDVLDLMTEGGAAALGQAGSVGRLAAGWRADLVVVEGDPSLDVSALRRIVAVYRTGRPVD